jgi:hypothetical protein
MLTPSSIPIEERIRLARRALAQIDRHADPAGWRQLVGCLGGLSTFERHGRAHFVSAGRIGFVETVRRHWHGDAGAYVDHLHERGLLAACDHEGVLMLDLYRQYRPDLLELR